MAFKVYLTTDEQVIHEYGDSSRFKFSEGGRLSVTSGDTQPAITYGPNGWAYVEAEPGHATGAAKGDKNATFV
jgi:hypothetical protein